MRAGCFIAGELRSCLRCRTTFNAIRAKHVYCTDACNRLVYNELYKSSPRTCRCVICESEFTPNSSQHRMCSQGCIIVQRRRKSLAAKYDLNQDTFNDLLRAQGNACIICLTKEADRWAVDHDHACCIGKKTCGKCIRGILCFKCNTALGLFKDSLQNISRALAYLSGDK